MSDAGMLDLSSLDAKVILSISFSNLKFSLSLHFHYRQHTKYGEGRSNVFTDVCYSVNDVNGGGCIQDTPHSPGCTPRCTPHA